MATKPHNRRVEPWFNRDVPVLVPRKQTALILNVCPETISVAWCNGDLTRVQAPGTTTPRGYRTTRSSIEEYAREHGIQLPWLEEDAA
jgi:hypothetical protein